MQGAHGCHCAQTGANMPGHGRASQSLVQLARSGRQLLELLLQAVEIDWLGNEVGGAITVGHAAALLIAIGRHHHHPKLRPTPFDFVQERQPVHAGHVDVGQDDDEFRPNAIAQPGECVLARAGKMQHVEPLPHLSPKLLTKQFGDIGFVIDNQDADAHGLLPDGEPILSPPPSLELGIAVFVHIPLVHDRQAVELRQRLS